MKLSEFWANMEHEFGATYARLLARDLVLQDFGNITAQDALDRGADVRSVWLAICQVQEIPEARRLGLDLEPKK